MLYKKRLVVFPYSEIILALIQFVEWLALIGGILVLLAGILGLKAK